MAIEMKDRQTKECNLDINSEKIVEEEPESLGFIVTELILGIQMIVLTLFMVLVIPFIFFKFEVMRFFRSRAGKNNGN